MDIPVVLFLALALPAMVRGETLGEVLRARQVPAGQLSASDLGERITSWAESVDRPFLLAYYTDDGSGQLKAPLHVIRYDFVDGLRRADVRAVRMDCLGSALDIGEVHGVVHIDIHGGPSAGCLLLLSPRLTLRGVLSGWLLGMVGENLAVVEKSEGHFAVEHLRIAVHDLQRDRLTEVYPPAQDTYRQRFSRALQAHMPSDEWCRIQDVPCDPHDFNSELDGKLAVNEAAKVFGFVARYDAGCYGDETARQVPPLAVAYIYRLHDGRWEHRAFRPERLRGLFGVETVDDLVERKPHAPFQP